MWRGTVEFSFINLYYYLANNYLPRPQCRESFHFLRTEEVPAMKTTVPTIVALLLSILNVAETTTLIQGADEDQHLAHALTPTRHLQTPCPDPLTEVLKTLDCFQQEDLNCTIAGYDTANFRLLHNGIDTGVDMSDPFYFVGIFLSVDFTLDFDHQAVVGANKLSLRYIETLVTTNGEDFGRPASNLYPFSQTFIQHEHALVTVDNDCKITLWDQYGDNKEQRKVKKVGKALEKKAISWGIKCALSLKPKSLCEGVPDFPTSDINVQLEGV